MAVRVLVVDDSGFFRRRVTEILESDPLIKVIGIAENGEEAINQTKALKPDVITMDIEMPVLDGITATRRIMQTCPTRIIMFSSLTTDGAKSTLDALEAGALDFLPKRFEDISSDREEAKQILCEKVRHLALQSISPQTATPTNRTTPVPKRQPATENKVSGRPLRASATGKNGEIDLVAIGTSTGGPVALQEVLNKLPGTFSKPIIVVQHMPASFTPAFAQRLDGQCNITVREAQDGDVLQAGVAYLAPGGRQMLLNKKGTGATIRIIDAEPGQTYKPSVDMTFSSIAKIFPNNTLGIILTGMGADGREGARELHQGGSTIWAQDEQSCVVYGMPAAVAEAGIADRILDIREIGISITKRV